MMGGALSHVALLFAIPTCHAEGEDMLAGKVLPDYRRAFSHDVEKARGEIATFLPDAEYLLDLAGSECATIVRRADLAALAKATVSHTVIIYFGHARGAYPSPEDIAFDAWPSECKAQADHPVFGTLAGCGSADDIVEELITIILRGRLLPHLPVEIRDALAGNASMAETIARDMIDEAFPRSIRPGNMIEMFDGLHRLRRFIDAIDARFHGELDLTMCHSVALSTLLDLRRGGTINHIHWNASVTPQVQFFLVGETLKRLIAGSHDSASQNSYISTRMLLHRDIGTGECA